MATEDLRYDGQVALITGAGRGIGREHALLLASRGCKVIINDPGIAYDGEGSTQTNIADQLVEEITYRNDARHGPSYFYLNNEIHTKWFFRGNKVNKLRYDQLTAI